MVNHVVGNVQEQFKHTLYGIKIPIGKGGMHPFTLGNKLYFNIAIAAQTWPEISGLGNNRPGEVILLDQALGTVSLLLLSHHKS